MPPTHRMYLGYSVFNRIAQLQVLGHSLKGSITTWLWLRKILLSEEHLKWRRLCKEKPMYFMKRWLFRTDKTDCSCFDFIQNFLFSPICQLMIHSTQNNSGGLSLIFILPSLEKIKFTSDQRCMIWMVLMKY